MDYSLIDYTKLSDAGTTTFGCVVSVPNPNAGISLKIGVVGDMLSIPPDDMIRLFKYVGLKTEPLQELIDKYL